ncbi:hypothetical protein AB6A40_000469 [Gnathostoma spinigerum]|uniref:Autophagy-related protein 2 n=1 Tax=Gnathostoma spinigerum TaxID=75299 RepID=A0ABD6E265_9BILA
MVSSGGETFQPIQRFRKSSVSNLMMRCTRSARVMGWTLDLEKKFLMDLINRYLSDYFSSHGGLVYKQGLFQLEKIHLNVEKLNESLKCAGLSIALVDGYIENICVSSKFPKENEPFAIQINELQITLQSEVSSNLVSSVSSLNSSISTKNLAQGVGENDENDESVEKFAKMIEQISSSVRLVFNDTVIRVENLSKDRSGSCTAVELRIKSVHYFNGQIEECEVDDGPTDVTSQSSVHSSCKIVRIEDVRLYTDIFTRPEDESFWNSQVSAAMSFKWERERQKSYSPGIDEADLSSYGPVQESSLYESCASSVKSMDKSTSALINSEASKGLVGRLDSAPVLFAKFIGNINVRVNSSSDKSLNKKDINVSLVGVHMFLCYNQLFIIHQLFNKILAPPSPETNTMTEGRPMEAEDEAQVERVIQDEFYVSSEQSTFERGNWSGPVAFSEVILNQPHEIVNSARLSPISLEDIMPPSSQKVGHKNRARTRSEETLTQARLSERIHFKATISQIVIVVTHKDFIKENRHLSRVLEAMTETFFKEAALVEFTSLTKLSSHRSLFDKLYSGDHLRFIAAAITVDYETRYFHETSSLMVAVSNVDFIESLTPSSVDHSTGITHIPLIDFSQSGSEQIHPHFELLISNDEPNQGVNVKIHLAPCWSEFDVSFIDRFSELFYSNLFSNDASKFSTVASYRNYSLDTSLDPSSSDSQSSSLPPSLIITSSSWKVNLRIPVTDLLQRSRMRKIREESFLFELNNVSTNMSLVGLSKNVRLELLMKCESMNIFFCGESQKLHCLKEEEQFIHLYGSKETENNIRISVSYGPPVRHRFGSSESVRLNGSYHFDNDEEDANFLLKNVTRKEGPFVHQLLGDNGKQNGLDESQPQFSTRIRSRDELKKFSEKSVGAGFVVEVNVQLMRLHLPSLKFYELLYNRLINDLVMWLPSAPVCDGKSEQSFYYTSTPPNSGNYHSCRSNHSDDGSNSDFDEDSSGVNISDNVTAVGANSAPDAFVNPLSLKINIDSGVILIDYPSDMHNQSNGFPRSECHLEDVEFFYISEYPPKEGTALSYVYATIEKLRLYHTDSCDISAKYESVCNTNFSLDETCLKLEPVTDRIQVTSSTDESCVALALRFDYKAKENSQDILMAFSLKNSVLKIDNIWAPTSTLWINEMATLLTPADYGTPGYTPPRVTKRLNLNLSNVVLSYDHSIVISDSPLRVRIVCGSCDLNTKIVENHQVYKFGVTFDEIMLFLNNEKTIRKPRSNNAVLRNMDDIRETWIYFLCINILRIEVGMVYNTDTEVLGDTVRCRLRDIICRNALLEIWACSDSISAFINMLVDIWETSTREVMLKQKTVNHDNCQTPGNIMELMTSAMKPCENESREQPCTVPQDKIEFGGKYVTSSQQRTESTGTDESFCVVDEEIGSGVTNPSGDPRVRFLTSERLSKIENHFNPKSLRVDALRLPDSYSQPLMRYAIHDFSFTLHLYGGKDFYFTDKTPRSTIFSTEDCRDSGRSTVNVLTGGYDRDYTTHIEVKLLKMSYLHQLFTSDIATNVVNIPVSAIHLFSIHDLEVIDHLAKSRIKKMLYQYEADAQPRRSYAPMFCLRVMETDHREGKMKVSMLPIKLNVHQETAEFLYSFYADFSKTCFSNKEVESQEVEGRGLENLNQMLNEEVSSEGCIRGNDATTDTESYVFNEISDVAEEKAAEGFPNAITDDAEGHEIFFREFSFSPSVIIRLDYVAEQVKTEQGLTGCVLGLSNFNSTQLQLKEFHNSNGLLGYARCIKFAFDEWTNDIQDNLLLNLIGSYGPISPFFQIGQGLKDLLFMPFDEYRKVDGHIVKGLQRGAESFGSSAAGAVVDISQRVIGFFQSVAEWTFDIITPDSPPYCIRRQAISHPHHRTPTDFKDGILQAYETVREGVVDTASAMQSAAQRERDSGQSSVRALLRGLPPAILRNVISSSSAASQVLDGLKSHIKPESHRDEANKWKS